MRRNRSPHSPPSPFRAIAHHQAQVAVHSGSSQHGRAPDPATLLRFFNVDTNPSRPMKPSPLTASPIADMPLDLLDRIRSFPLFQSAPEDFLVAIGAHLRPQIHSAQDHILTEGDDAKAMYWLVRGVVAVTSRDGEAVYAELTPGAFFGEIGVLMNIPRTANVVARTKCLLVVLKKEDLHAELPKYPDMEKAIRQEAQERLTILNKKRQESGHTPKVSDVAAPNVAREPAPGEVSKGEVGAIKEGAVINSKKRKSPSPGVIEDPVVGSSALGSGIVNVRKTLKELPLFSTLPPDILHFLGLSAQPKTYSPFTDIIRQGTPGNEIFFIVRGEAEVIHELLNGHKSKEIMPAPYTRPRLKQGQYFGEVASLGLSPGRTATVRSITAVECLIIGGEALDELWRRCPPEIKLQVEETARRRYQNKADEDVEMSDALVPPTSAEEASPIQRRQSLPHVTFTTPQALSSPTKGDNGPRQPSDPDPYLSVDMENMRNRRRNSLAPPNPTPTEAPATNICGPRSQADSIPSKASALTPVPSDDLQGPSKRPRVIPRRPLSRVTFAATKAALPDDLLVAVFQQLEILDLLRLRQVNSDWRRLLATSPKLCTHLDLSPYNRNVNDWVIINVLAPFVGARPEEIDISNCFHITDEGFRVLWRLCGQNVKIWRMKSVWDVSANQILDMSEHAKSLEEVDWSNCRKVGDNLLARVVGWVVPEPQPPREASRNVIIASSTTKSRHNQQKDHLGGARPSDGSQKPASAAPGTVFGCSALSRLDLSYCKHITDRSMAHLAAHAAGRLRALSLTRCTSITDAGFQSWAPYRFSKLTHLCLADCTYLTDNSVIALVNAAKGLTHLDLSFCCALSDTATEVAALGLPRLKELRLAFCGSAVSDASLGCIALHLNELRGLSVRGCVRVTGVGVENVLEGCGRLQWLDVSQCKNLGGWLAGGGVRRWGHDDRSADDAAAEGVFTFGQETDQTNWSVAFASGSDNIRTATSKSHSLPAHSVAAAGGKARRPVISASIASPEANPGKPKLVKAMGPGPMLKPVIPPKGARSRRVRKPVRFIVEKGADGLR